LSPDEDLPEISRSLLSRTGGTYLKSQCAVFIAVAAVLFSFTASGQGLYVESKTSTGDKIEKFWYRPHMFRSTEEKGKITVIRLDKEVIYSIDPDKRTYSELSFSEMNGMRDKIAAMMKKRMESMSPEQRKMLEGKMGEAKERSSRYEVSKTGETKSISGFTCTKYVVKRYGGETETVWAAADIGGGMESLRQDMEQFMKKMSTSLGTGKVGTEWYTEIRGFPIQTESHGSTRTVTKIEQRSINGSEFEVPAGYTKVKEEGMSDRE
jgi:hypothetical protein